MTAEHHVQSLCCRALEHQQSQFVGLGEDIFLYNVKLPPELQFVHSRLKIHVHSHCVALHCGALESTVVVRHTGVVELYHPALGVGIAVARLLGHVAVVLRVAQCGIILEVGDGAHDFRPILIFYHVYTHLNASFISFFITVLKSTASSSYTFIMRR